MTNRPASSNNVIVAAQAHANSTTIDLSGFVKGAIHFSSDPGAVTVYARCGEDDSWAAANDTSGSPISFSPGVLPNPIPADCFNYNEIRFQAANDVTGGTHYASFKPL